MKSNIVNLVNAIVLILFGLWGYFTSDEPSVTAFIPVVFGIILISLNSGLKKENKISSHIIVVLTLLVLIGLVKPLLGTIERGDSIALIRVIIMIFTSTIAMVTFVKSFIDARRE